MTNKNNHNQSNLRSKKIRFELLKYIDSFLSVPEFDENGDDNWDGQTSRDLLTQIKLILEKY